MDSTGSEQDPAAGSCEHGNKHLGFITGGDQLSNYQLLRNNSTPWSEIWGLSRR